MPAGKPVSADLAERLRLIVVADVDSARGLDLIGIVRAALAGGAPAVQLRAKKSGGREMFELAQALLQETRAAGALLFVNDRVDVALAAGADGAHIGDDDLPLAAARRMVPSGFLLGRSVETEEQAVRAEREGADYLGAGAVYPTGSKADAGTPIGTARLAAISRAVAIPTVAIGGIGVFNAAEVMAAGAAGIAVIRAVLAAPDPRSAARELTRLAKPRG